MRQGGSAGQTPTWKEVYLEEMVMPRSFSKSLLSITRSSLRAGGRGEGWQRRLWLIAAQAGSCEAVHHAVLAAGNSQGRCGTSGARVAARHRQPGCRARGVSVAAWGGKERKEFGGEGSTGALVVAVRHLVLAANGVSSTRGA